MIKILFVCLGNICRSPLAQAIFEEKIKKLGVESKFHVDSAGIRGWHEGEKPNAGSINVAKIKGVPIEHQRSRPVSLYDREQFDYFIAMDRDNEYSLINEFGLPREKVFLMRSFQLETEGKEVPDPYGQGVESFNNVYNILDEATDQFIVFLKKNHPEIG